jgi:hypothetical protein
MVDNRGGGEQENFGRLFGAFLHVFCHDALIPFAFFLVLGPEIVCLIDNQECASAVHGRIIAEPAIFLAIHKGLVAHDTVPIPMPESWAENVQFFGKIFHKTRGCNDNDPRLRVLIKVALRGYYGRQGLATPRGVNRNDASSLIKTVHKIYLVRQQGFRASRST